MQGMKAAKVLVVDDEPIIGDLLVNMLKDEFCVEVARSGQEALKAAQQGGVELILLDVVMPVMNGFEVCQALKADPRTSHIPVLFITVQNDVHGESRGFSFGAVDYITKPFIPQVVRTRIRNNLALASQQRHLELLVRKRTLELEETGLHMIRQLGRFLELRDGEAGEHVERVSDYAYLIARSAGLSEEQALQIRTVAPLHDLGKIGVPEQILLKRGPLDPDEWSVVHTHCEVGYRMIGDHENGLLHTAALGAYCHHERWDGGGYPRGLKGESIPLVARILAVADVFDALTRERPYKPAWSFDVAVAEMRHGAGSQFDPFILHAFLSALPQIRSAVGQ